MESTDGVKDCRLYDPASFTKKQVE